MADSWWDIGEWSGHSGSNLDMSSLTCPFCGELGGFEIVHHEERKRTGARKTLNFDTLKCEGCGNFHMVFWSGSRMGNLHERYQVPWPRRLKAAPKEWPEDVGRLWVQAHRSISDENWDAAIMVAGSALQAAMRDQKAKGKTLAAEIDDLSDRGILPAIMKEWSHELRALRNLSAHPKSGEIPPKPTEVRDLVKFLDYLFRYLYSLPKEIERYRSRRNPTAQ